METTPSGKKICLEKNNNNGNPVMSNIPKNTSACFVFNVLLARGRDAVDGVIASILRSAISFKMHPHERAINALTKKNTIF